jgi:hypothetical protein
MAIRTDIRPYIRPYGHIFRSAMWNLVNVSCFFRPFFSSLICAAFSSCGHCRCVIFSQFSVFIRPFCSPAVPYRLFSLSCGLLFEFRFQSLFWHTMSVVFNISPHFSAFRLPSLLSICWSRRDLPLD